MFGRWRHVVASPAMRNMRGRALSTRIKRTDAMTWRSSASLFRKNQMLRSRWNQYRAMSAAGQEGKTESTIEKIEARQDAVSTEVTFQEGVKSTATGTLALTAAGLAVVCGYFIVSELFPTRMSPNHVFNEALDVVRKDQRLQEALGTPIKGYGRDHGQKRTGRRNFVEHKKFKDEDEVNHTRIRFNAEGPRGKAVIYADVSENGGKDEFYYLIVEVPRQKKKWAIQDNRPRVPRAIRQDEVASLLQQRANAVLYGGDSCQWTRKQMAEFGDAFKRIKYVQCDKDPEYCQRRGVMHLPTWELHGRLTEPGFKTMDDLAVMATETSR